MNLPETNFSRPRFSLRFFLYFLFGLVILILIVEGGYYFWVQKEIKKQQTPITFRQKGIFTLVQSERTGTQKQIWGVTEEINGSDLVIKTENGEQVKIKYKNEKIWIVEKYVDAVTESSIVEENLSNLFLGDEVQLSQIETDAQGNLFASYLAVIR